MAYCKANPPDLFEFKGGLEHDEMRDFEQGHQKRVKDMLKRSCVKIIQGLMKERVSATALMQGVSTVATRQRLERMGPTSRQTCRDYHMTSVRRSSWEHSFIHPSMHPFIHPFIHSFAHPSFIPHYLNAASTRGPLLLMSC